MTPPLADLVMAAADWLRQADGLLITAGAGMGVDSGLPDFRGNEGFWQHYPALRESGQDFASIASPLTFFEDPLLAWGFYGHRLQLYKEAIPHTGFALLRKWADKLKHGAFVVTSNVDGQFQKAGFAADQVYEIHGSLHHLQCLQPCGDRIWSAQDVLPEVDIARCRLTSPLPRCPDCGGLARPNILMFYDGAWLESRAAEQQARWEAWRQQVSRLVVVELGAGTALPSIRMFGERLRTPLIRLNPGETAGSGPQLLKLPLGALAGLQAMDEALLQAPWRAWLGNGL